MGYNRLNYLRRCKIIIDIVNAHYIADVTTYSGVFRNFVKPFYPMSDKSFMKIVNMPNIERQIREEIERIGGSSGDKPEALDSNQLCLFE